MLPALAPQNRLWKRLMRRLIIGCGYLGQRVATRWLESGGEVHVLTRSLDHAQSFRERGWNPITGDVLDPKSLEQLPEVDTIFWAVGWDRSSGRTMRDVYVTGLENVLRQVQGRCRRFITISSTSVYGQNQGEWVDEQSICMPGQPNGQTCLEAERTLLAHDGMRRSESGMRATVLRLSGIYGPDRLLSRVATLKSGTPLEAVVKCELLDSVPDILLVSDNEPIHRRDYYSTLARLVGASEPQFASKAAAADESPRQFNKKCRNELARRMLNWIPQFPTYREGLVHAVQNLT
jgi:nucleoside-diphosphate-sugar epimerase